MYVLMKLRKNLAISFLGIEQELPLCWATGMIGAVPVFNTEEEAEKFRGDSEAEIYEVKYKEATDD